MYKAGSFFFLKRATFVFTFSLLILAFAFFIYQTRMTTVHASTEISDCYYIQVICPARMDDGPNPQSCGPIKICPTVKDPEPTVIHPSIIIPQPTEVTISPDPKITCTPPPSCLYSNPRCMLPWRDDYCPLPSFEPKPTCIKRPPCLDTNPHCEIAQPVDGWCPEPTIPHVSEDPKPSSTQPSPSVTVTITPTLTQSPIRGDFNNDGFVNLLDFNMLRNCIRHKFLCTENMDLNQDGKINGEDMKLFLRLFLRIP